LSADAADAVPGDIARPLDLSNFFLAALSNILAGWIVVVAGYREAFISLGIIAAAGLALYAIAMPDTGPQSSEKAG
jgi:drug/metabolite transporter superfamily protein YnfA